MIPNIPRIMLFIEALESGQYAQRDWHTSPNNWTPYEIMCEVMRLQEPNMCQWNTKSVFRVFEIDFLSQREIEETVYHWYGLSYRAKIQVYGQSMDMLQAYDVPLKTVALMIRMDWLPHRRGPVDLYDINALKLIKTCLNGTLISKEFDRHQVLRYRALEKKGLIELYVAFMLQAKLTPKGERFLRFANALCKEKNTHSSS